VTVCDDQNTYIGYWWMEGFFFILAVFHAVFCIQMFEIVDDDTLKFCGKEALYRSKYNGIYEKNF